MELPWAQPVGAGLRRQRGRMPHILSYPYNVLSAKAVFAVQDRIYISNIHSHAVIIQIGSKGPLAITIYFFALNVFGVYIYAT